MLALAAASTVLYWALYLDNQRAQEERRAALSSTTAPIPLNGFKPVLRGITDSGYVPLADDGMRRLLLVVSDNCPGSASAVPQWIDWIGQSKTNSYSAIVISLVGDQYSSQLMSAFRARGISSSSIAVSRADEFVLASGVTVTPTLLGLDPGGRVRLVASRLTHTARNQLNLFLTGE